jgi:hypothetical protein
LAPTIGSSSRAPSPGCSTSGGAVNTSRRSSGSDSTTNGGWPRSRIVNRDPYRARSRSTYTVGRLHQPIVCTSVGALGPGGSVARMGGL